MNPTIYGATIKVFTAGAGCAEDAAILRARELRDLDYDLYDIWTDKIK